MRLRRSPGGTPHTSATYSEVLQHGQRLREAEALRHVADAPLHRRRVGHRVDAADRGAAGARHQQAGEEAQERRLAGAVRPDQPEQLAGLHLEGDPAQRFRRAVALLDAIDSDGGSGHGGNPKKKNATTKVTKSTKKKLEKPER